MGRNDAPRRWRDEMDHCRGIMRGLLLRLGNNAPWVSSEIFGVIEGQYNVCTSTNPFVAVENFIHIFGNPERNFISNILRIKVTIRHRNDTLCRVNINDHGCTVMPTYHHVRSPGASSSS